VSRKTVDAIASAREKTPEQWRSHPPVKHLFDSFFFDNQKTPEQWRFSLSQVGCPDSTGRIGDLLRFNEFQRGNDIDSDPGIEIDSYHRQRTS
jgi:hypothetical protein